MGIIAASRLRAAVSNIFLNQFSDASLGLSLDLLDSNYNGNCIKVRRSSDDTELDIGFFNNVIDTSSLLAFVGSGDAFVTIIYDQVGTNNMIQNNASLQGKIVSNGSIILKGGKPCIVRSANDDGGYLSDYNVRSSFLKKGMFYVGDNEGRNGIIFGSQSGDLDFGFAAQSNSSSNSVDSRPNISLTKLNGFTTTISTVGEAFTKTNKHFLLYREIEFNYNRPTFSLGYREVLPNGFGMFTFQELVIFENTDDAVAKENNINSRYNIY
jgi:hypothetical protein